MSDPRTAAATSPSMPPSPRRPSRVPAADRLDAARPIAWLRAGWQDFRQAPSVSLGYGALAVAVGFVVVAALATMRLDFLILPITAGFMLLAPVLATGLYEVSRRLKKQTSVSMAETLTAFTRNPGGLLNMGLVLMLALLGWIRIAMLLFVLFFAETAPSAPDLLQKVFFSDQTLPFFLTGSAVGFLLAFLVFSISVISIPMLIDRPIGAMTAIITSITVVRRHLLPLFIWALMIAAIMLAGMALALVGVAVAFPVIGYASWHAYEDLAPSAEIARL